MAFIAAAPVLHAEAGNPLNDTFSISLGGFLLNTKTTLRVDGDVPGSGTTIDTERDLGIKDSDRFRIDGYWRMTPRQKIRVMFFNTNNSAEKVLQRDIEYNDQIYPVSATVKAEVKTQVTEVAYEFDFMQSDTYELGVTGGIHNLSFKTSLGIVGANQNLSQESESSANGPLPVIGLRGLWRFGGGKFYAEAATQFFRINFDPYDGRLTDLNASLAWQATQHFAFGLGWNDFVTRVDVAGNKFNGSLRWRYGGARLFVTASF